MSVCIFCRSPSEYVTSCEHIIPESLGCNEKLPRGIVCDKCNNYFSSEIDKALQEYHFIGILKALLVAKTKKGKCPTFNLDDIQIKGEQIGNEFLTQIHCEKVIDDKAHKRVIFKFRRLFPSIQYVSRELYKIVLEMICLRKGVVEALKPEYDELRNYVRRPKPKEYWPFAQKCVPMKDRPFLWSMNTKYLNCYLLRIFDLEFIMEKNGNIPIKELENDEYEIIDREKWDICETERTRPKEEWGEETLIFPYG
jgi:hypothetical protein